MVYYLETVCVYCICLCPHMACLITFSWPMCAHFQQQIRALLSGRNLTSVHLHKANYLILSFEIRMSVYFIISVAWGEILGKAGKNERE